MIGRLTLFVGASALSGVLVAALAVPFLGSVGLVAKDSAESFQNLPSELELPPLPIRDVAAAAHLDVHELGGALSGRHREHELVGEADDRSDDRLAVLALGSSATKQRSILILSNGKLRR